MSNKENSESTKPHGSDESANYIDNFPKYKIAVASSDGKVVNQHFGHSRQFIVFEVVDEAGNWSFYETRITNPVCSNGEHKVSSMQEVVALLSDCKAVVVSQIGIVAEQSLNSEGVLVFSSPDFIDIALEEVIRRLSSD